MILLETNRLLLREISTDDFEDWFSILGDKQSMTFYPEAFNAEKVMQWINWNKESYLQNGFGLWAVLLKDNNRFIGDCGITLQSIEGDLLPELGYHIHKNHWNQGYASEAAKAVMEYAFQKIKLNRLYTYTQYKNVPSMRVAEKNGMKFMKTFYKEVMGQEVKEVLYSISAQEYFQSISGENS